MRGLIPGEDLDSLPIALHLRQPCEIAPIRAAISTGAVAQVSLGSRKMESSSMQLPCRIQDRHFHRSCPGSYTLSTRFFVMVSEPQVQVLHCISLDVAPMVACSLHSDQWLSARLHLQQQEASGMRGKDCKDAIFMHIIILGKYSMISYYFPKHL